MLNDECRMMNEEEATNYRRPQADLILHSSFSILHFLDEPRRHVVGQPDAVGRAGKDEPFPSILPAAISSRTSLPCREPTAPAVSTRSDRCTSCRAPFFSPSCRIASRCRSAV